MAHIMLPGKGFSLTASGDRLIAATSTRHLLVYDIRRYTAQSWSSGTHGAGTQASLHLVSLAMPVRESARSTTQ